jgi:hypothetical protein
VLVDIDNATYIIFAKAFRQI